MIQQYRFSANMENTFDCFKNCLNLLNAVIIMMLVVLKEIIRKIKYQIFNMSGTPLVHVKNGWIQNQPRIGSDFHANHQRTLLTSKKLCGNWQAKEKHTRNYQLVGWRISFFSTYQRLGPMSQRKSVFSGTHCFHTQILKPHLNFSNRHPSPIHAAPTT